MNCFLIFFYRINKYKLKIIQKIIYKPKINKEQLENGPIQHGSTVIDGIKKFNISLRKIHTRKKRNCIILLNITYCIDLHTKF